MKSFLFFIFLFYNTFLLSQPFTDITSNSNLVKTDGGSIAIADVDGNQTQDVLISSSENPTNRAILYINDGIGNFTEKTGTPFENLGWSSAAFADVDGNQTQDLLITGIKDFGSGVYLNLAKLYLNDGMGNFTEMAGTPFPGVTMGSIYFADINGDSTQDVLFTGYDGMNSISKLYLNNGQGVFSELNGTNFAGVRDGKGIIADMNGDHKPDVIVTGSISDSTITKLYINNGLGVFVEKTGLFLPGSKNGDVSVADIDGNGTNDVLISGFNYDLSSFTEIFLNDGNANFTRKTNTGLTPVDHSTSDLVDIDGNGTEDIFLTGFNSFSVEFIAKLYLNDGFGNFTEQTGMPFIGLYRGTVGFPDLDGNSTKDIILNGWEDGSDLFIGIYRNDSWPTSIDEIQRENLSFEVFPNPAFSNEVFIDYSSTKREEIKVEILDIAGRVISSSDRTAIPGEEAFSLDISLLSKGYYFVQINNGNRTGVKSFTVK